MSQTEKESKLIMEIAAYVQEHNRAAQWEARWVQHCEKLRSAKQRGLFSLVMGIVAIVLATSQTSAAGLGVATGLFVYNGAVAVTLLLLAKRYAGEAGWSEMVESAEARSKRARTIDDLAFEIWGDKNIRIKFDRAGKIDGIIDVLACLGLKEESFESAQGKIFKREKTFA